MPSEIAGTRDCFFEGSSNGSGANQGWHGSPVRAASVNHFTAAMDSPSCA